MTCRHNGAGKTTTISILTGMLESNGGDAWVNGWSIRSNPKEVQRSISVCPQHNIFFEELLCIEHLCFFAGLRGIDVQEPLLKLQNTRMYADEIMGAYQTKQQEKQFANMVGKEVAISHSDSKSWAGVLEMMDRFGIYNKLFSHPRTLSGGQKRRLWLALALLAEPSVVFLDEPTSGVDPVGRQEIWKVIQEERKSGRCIILTTHHMEEADILADRKAVMAAGRVRCLGTSLYLKSKFGIGYYLEIQLTRDLAGPRVDEARRNISSTVRKHIPTSRYISSEKEAGTMAAVSVTAGILTYGLPLDQIEMFGPLLEELESNKSSLGIAEYAMSMSTLEEVFFKLGEADTEEALSALMSAQHRGNLLASTTEGSVRDDRDASLTGQLGVHGRSRSSSAVWGQNADEFSGILPGTRDVTM